MDGIGEIKMMEVKTDIYNSKEYKLSRKAYVAQETFQYFILLLVADAFLAKLLTHIGISDALTGIISSFVSVAFLFQLLAIFLAGKAKTAKKVVVPINCASAFLCMCLYFVPFIPVGKEIKTIFVMFCVAGAYALNYLVSGMLFKWANSYVSPQKRAVFSAKKEIVSLLSGIVFTLVIGFIVDKYAEIGNIEGGFLFISIIILLLNIGNFISFMVIKSDKGTEKTSNEKEENFWLVVKDLFKNKNFSNVVLITTLYYIANGITAGFLGTFKTVDLAMSVGTVQVINIVGCFARAACSIPFGKFSDKRSFATGLKWGYIFAALSYVVIIFTTPNNWWLIVLFTILNSISVAGTNANSYNIVYSYVNSKYIVQAMAIKNSIAGICGFLATMAAGKLLDMIQKSGNMIFGIKTYGQHVLAILSVIGLLITVLCINKLLEKTKRSDFYENN